MLKSSSINRIDSIDIILLESPFMFHHTSEKFIYVAARCSAFYVLYCMMSNRCVKWIRSIEAFNSTSRYLDDLLNIDNIYFD